MFRSFGSTVLDDGLDSALFTFGEVRDGVLDGRRPTDGPADVDGASSSTSSFSAFACVR